MDVIPTVRSPVATTVQRGRTARRNTIGLTRFGPTGEIPQTVGITCPKGSKSRIAGNQSQESRHFPPRIQPGFGGRIVSDSVPRGGDRLGRIPPQNTHQSVSQELATDRAHRLEIFNLATGTHPTFDGGWF